ncbi:MULTISPECIES: ABC transporter permease [unclassified Enterococcus]|uniref:ABC transporter permease n=1 Tax=unclassified Enterococcus TaxID=2608891 RepID=UPI00155610C2|nr:MULTISPECIES: ABC transporter permease [unclassified Enterococcus]MBS7577757.1 ABC transporter permease [Enterococcus sp. MMGLQ5-2]MBS7584049.1 ABC transporter permease [Enterococcus sp. MMGLQ5-1]NPD11910.1 ABC transporter permease [Enterococcus sp. MMGLQ5-1]NPD37587.1 ABC transporter permease [Enterococcus sp. MMGLQ5-2]
MFLALNEIRHARLRYGLVVGVIFLIAYLVFFLSGLSYGLAQENRTAVDNWQADRILISDAANDNLGASQLDANLFNQAEAKQKAALSQASAVIYRSADKAKKENVSFFGIDQNQFLAPKISSGRMFESDREVVADSSLKTENGYQLGDTIKAATNDQALKIVGFTENAKYNTAPVLYMSFQTYQIANGASIAINQAEPKINAIVIKGKLHNSPAGVVNLSIKDFINELPGYSAQVLTFGFMIGFLVVIAAVVIGIFIYVLTMQKTPVFGVMKAQGISSGYIARSVIVQTFLLSLLGVLIGLVMTLITAFFLPNAVPFQSSTIYFIVVGVLMIIVSVLGAIFSVRSIVKIDPLRAIG